ncbi:DUF3987 domain-containing protein [Paraburkholderia sp. EG286B]|uniref:DUF3987 domain-containing protein n=1 Tax=Paraburkholderia sp. EG286B TaxID=3237011 RepID=UPI0034D33370
MNVDLDPNVVIDVLDDRRKSVFPNYEPPGDFPWQALPEMIRGAVLEICANDKVPIALAAQSALSAVSVACQDLVMVDRGIGDPSICSLFLLAVSDSGARKSTADHAVTAAIQQLDEDAVLEHEQQKLHSDCGRKFSQDEERALQRTYTSLMRKAYTGASAKAQEAAVALEEVQQMLMDIRRRAPEKAPQLRKTLYMQASMRELQHSLHENWPSAGWFANEAADLLESRSSADMARLDRLWDGQRIDVVGRTRRESFAVTDPRLTLSLMVQPDIFDRFIARKGELAKGIGFLPRTLIARAEPSYGERTIDRSIPRSTTWLELFNQRVRDLLEYGRVDIDQRLSKRSILHFSPAAQQLWDSVVNEKEAQTVDGARHVHEREFISRYGEHVARLAALFWFFETAILAESEESGRQQQRGMEIPDRIVESAIEITEWYLNEFRAIFNPDAQIAEVAAHVLKKLKERLRANNGGELPEIPTLANQNFEYPKHELRNFCTKFNLRKDRDLFDRAVAWLVQHGKISVYHKLSPTSTRRQTEYVQLKIAEINWRQTRSI